MKTAALITNIIFLIGLIPSFMGAIMSPMMFDAPGSEKSTKTWMLAGSVAILPLLIIIAQVISWIAFSNQNYELAFKINLIPTIDICIIILLFFIIDSFVN